MKSAAIISFALITLLAHGQVADSTSNSEILNGWGTASFPGGQDELIKFINSTFNWTQEQSTVAGKVFVEFWVEENGEITDSKVTRGLCDSCDKEALRIIKEMPNWIPHEQEGQTVRSKVVLPISFDLK